MKEYWLRDKKNTLKKNPVCVEDDEHDSRRERERERERWNLMWEVNVGKPNLNILQDWERKWKKIKENEMWKMNMRNLT